MAQVGTTHRYGPPFLRHPDRPSSMTPSIAALLGKWFWWPQVVRQRPVPQPWPRRSARTRLGLSRTRLKRVALFGPRQPNPMPIGHPRRTVSPLAPSPAACAMLANPEVERRGLGRPHWCSADSRSDRRHCWWHAPIVQLLSRLSGLDSWAPPDRPTPWPASSAGTPRPVRIMSIARLCPISRGSRTGAAVDERYPPSGGKHTEHGVASSATRRCAPRCQFQPRRRR